jgi:hypothetical protein
VCRQESRETLPLQLPLYSLALSLSHSIILRHMISHQTSPLFVYILAVSIYITFIVKLVGERWFF